MKRILSLMAVAILFSTFAVAAPAGAGEGTLLKSQLIDAPNPNIVGNGKVEIGSDLVVEIKIDTNLPSQTLTAVVECGGILARQRFALGSIETNKEGKGTASFDLEDYPDMIPGPALIGASFMILSTGGPVCATNYLVFDPPSPPPGPIVPGNINLVCHAYDAGGPVSDVSFNYTMSYGGIIGHVEGVSLKEDKQIESGPLAPGIYTITQKPLPGWPAPLILIDDSTAGSFSGYGTAVVDLKPGDSVIVRYINRQGPPPPGTGRIIVIKHTNPPAASGFHIDMSYGPQIGYPNGGVIGDDVALDSGYVLSPGFYTVTETPMPGWNSSIQIADPAGDSSVAGSIANINLAPGEIVIVTLRNIQTQP